jgi:hypothetical protein
VSGNPSHWSDHPGWSPRAKIAVALVIAAIALLVLAPFILFALAGGNGDRIEPTEAPSSPAAMYSVSQGIGSRYTAPGQRATGG